MTDGAGEWGMPAGGTMWASSTTERFVSSGAGFVGSKRDGLFRLFSTAALGCTRGAFCAALENTRYSSAVMVR